MLLRPHGRADEHRSCSACGVERIKAVLTHEDELESAALPLAA